MGGWSGRICGPQKMEFQVKIRVSAQVGLDPEAAIT